MRRMSAGSGYQYLLRSVAAGDGNRALSTPLTRYYSEVGTPPGRWLGSGVGAFGRRPAQARHAGHRGAARAADRDGPRPDHGRAARPRVSDVQAPGRPHRRARRGPRSRDDAGGLRGRDDQDRSRGDRARDAPCRGRVRPHLQRPEVGLGALGCRRRGHPGADRRRAPRGRRRRHRLLRARGRRDPSGHLRQRRCRRPGQRRRSRGGRLRPLRLPRRRPAAPHPRRRVQQGADR